MILGDIVDDEMMEEFPVTLVEKVPFTISLSMMLWLVVWILILETTVTLDVLLVDGKIDSLPVAGSVDETIIDGKVELTRMSKERLAGRRSVEFAGGVAIKTVSLTGVLSCLLLLIEAFFMTSDAFTKVVNKMQIINK